MTDTDVCVECVGLIATLYTNTLCLFKLFLCVNDFVYVYKQRKDWKTERLLSQGSTIRLIFDADFHLGKHLKNVSKVQL